MMEKLLNQMNKKSIAENITFIKNYIITTNNSNLVLVYRLFIKEWITLQLKLSPMLFFNKIQEIFKLVIPGEDLFVSVFLDSKAHSSKDVGFRPNLIWLFKVHWQRFLVLLIVIRDYRRRTLRSRPLVSCYDPGQHFVYCIWSSTVWGVTTRWWIDSLCHILCQ